LVKRLRGPRIDLEFCVDAEQRLCRTLTRRKHQSLEELQLIEQQMDKRKREIATYSGGTKMPFSVGRSTGSGESIRRNEIIAEVGPPQPSLFRRRT
jgi:hypothetical protein